MSLKKKNSGDEDRIEFLLQDVSATRELGRVLADSLDRGAVIALHGNLGAGKTTLVQALGKALGVSEVITSPTFTMMNEYHSGRLPLYHFDFYRVMEMAERQEQDLSLDLVASEFDEISESRKAVLVVEWPEYFRVEGASYLDPVDHLVLTLAMDGVPRQPDANDARFSPADEQRLVTITATGLASSALLAKIQDQRAQSTRNI